MRTPSKGARVVALVLLVHALLATPALATNGMYLTGYGPETQARGGANIAISDRTLALNFNPAGISQLQGNHTAASMSVMAPALTYDNRINGNVDAEGRLFPLPAVAYVRSGAETPWTWGIGVVAQGGMGATFEGTNTYFGTVDETYTQVRFATLSPTVAYSLSDDMALGATLNIGYADAAFRFFPRTSFFNAADPNQSFFGVDMDAAGGLQTSLRLGWWWRANRELSFGAIYQTETDSTFDDGDMMVNFTAHPFLGQKVHYTADLDGFTFASQAGVGMAWRPTPDWVMAIDVKRYFWDSAIDTITVTAHDPDMPGAPQQITLPFVFDWEDQWVVAVGGDYRWNERLTLRAGYNYGENPVPDATLNPLFPANTEHHLSAGLSWLSHNRVYELAVEHAFENDQTNDNPDPMVNPFGPGSRVGHEQWTVSFGVSWAWERSGR